MFRAVAVFLLTLSGCANIGVSAWDESKISCPDSEYDNGGSVKPMLGYCKIGRGVFISYDQNF